MMCAATAGVLGSKSKVLSMQNDGSMSQGFLVSGIGEISLPCTFLAWYRFPNVLAWQQWAGSRMVFKAGNSSNGIGYGASYYSVGNDGRYFTQRGALVEAKYWKAFSYNVDTTPSDVSWHHLAVIMKYGSNPTIGTFYVDSTLQVNADPTANGTSGMNTPTSEFSICGRYRYDSLQLAVQVCRAAIVGREMSQIEILADMNLGPKSPTDSSLTHYWDGTVENNQVKDLIGNWNLTPSSSCSIVSASPWK